MKHGLPLGVLVRIAVRNLWVHKVKTLIVASIMLFGTALVVVGNALLDSVVHSMSQSIVGSVAGHLQVYSKDAKDKLALFGGMVMGGEDVGIIEDFSKVKASLSTIDNIKSIVPMGIDDSLVFGGNSLDRELSALRNALTAGRTDDAKLLKEHVRQMVLLLEKDLGNLKEISNEQTLRGEDVQNVKAAAADTFWADFDADPLAKLEILENDVAPLALDGDMIFLRYIGTDLDAFASTFDRFRIIEGTQVPKGQRGFLLNHNFNEKWLKDRTARRLDEIRDARAEGRLIATDPDLESSVKRNVTQYKEIVLQIDPLEAPEVTEKLRELLGSSVPADADLTALVQAFLAMDDTTFDARFQFFYDVLAPRMELYRVPVGTVLTLTAFTRSGYMKSANVPIYGVFKFESLEKSDLAGAFSLMDLQTFRDLFGYRTAADKAEIAAIKASVKVKDVDRADAEDALFGGGGDEVVAEAAPTGFDEFAGVDLKDRPKYDEALLKHVYTQEEIEHGIVLNASIMLKDPSLLPETRAEIMKVSERDGLNLQVMDWNEASGLVGQFITVIRLVLYVAIFVIFCVAIVIINNSMVMATMERVREIGTMRAIGAQRTLILGMLFVETMVIAVLFGGIGAAVGSGIILALGQIGIPATSDILHFLFAGPRLYPFLLPIHLGIAVVIMFLVSVASTFYPAFIATRITPLEAMQKED